MEEIEKYTKLWDLPQGYGNNYDHPYWVEIATTLKHEMGLTGIHQSHKILDVGGGDQRLAKFFTEHSYASLDIAPNAMEPGENAYPHTVTDISQYRGHANEFHWVISIDVMEHIPPTLIDDAIANIWNTVTEGAAFLISTRPDRGGKKIGAILHMTVREPKWWVEKMGQYWSKVSLVRIVSGEYCLLVCRHSKSCSAKTQSESKT